MQIIKASPIFIKPYVSVQPTDLSIKKLKKFCSFATIPSVTPDNEWHCTIIYDEVEQNFLQVKKSIMPSLLHLATIVDVDLFFDIDSKTLNLVALLECDTLQKRQEYFLTRGMHNSFPTYKPHITMSHNPWEVDLSIPGFDYAKRVLEFAQTDLKKVILDSKPIQIYLHKENLSSLNED